MKKSNDEAEEAVAKTDHEPLIELIDGEYVNMETGEIVGLELPEFAKEQFSIDSEEKMEWFFKKLFDIDSKEEMYNRKIESIIANYKKILTGIQKSRQNLEARFGAEVIEFAKAAIDGGKSKTWKCAYGSVSFRMSPKSCEILPEDESNPNDAVYAYFERNYPEAVKIKKSILKSQINKAIS